MRQTILALVACLALTASSVWAAGTVTLQPNETIAIGGNQCDLTVASATSSAVHVACGPGYDLIEGVPICTDHDPTKWHPLVRRNPDSSIACTYGHEHHTNPNSANDIFGPPSAWYGGTQEISYPWQTASALGQENQVKHQGYKWHVLRDMECKPAGGPSDGCIRAVRIQTHTLGTAADAVVRFHSYSFEALVEFGGRQGIVRHGGWLDFGHLTLGVDGGGGHLCPPLSGDPTYPCASGPTRNHSSTNVPPPHVAHNAYLSAWYSEHKTTQLSTTFEEWGPIDYANPSNQRFFGEPGRNANNSRGGIGNMFVGLLGNFWDWFRQTQGGVITFTGHTDRYGAPIHPSNDTCTAPGVDCVPLALSNVMAVNYTWNAGVQGTLPPEHFAEHDVLSPQTGKSLIAFPN